MKKKLSVLCLILFLSGIVFSQDNATDSIATLAIKTERSVITEWIKTIDIINQRNAQAEKLITNIDISMNQQNTQTKELANCLNTYKSLKFTDSILINPESFKTFSLQLENINNKIGAVLSFAYNHKINNAAFQEIQIKLASTENRLAVQCQKFNESASSYNKIIKHATPDFFDKYPNLCKKKCYFVAKENNREEAPVISF